MQFASTHIHMYTCMLYVYMYAVCIHVCCMYTCMLYVYMYAVCIHVCCMYTCMLYVYMYAVCIHVCCMYTCIHVCRVALPSFSLKNKIISIFHELFSGEFTVLYQTFLLLFVFPATYLLIIKICGLTQVKWNLEIHSERAIMISKYFHRWTVNNIAWIYVNFCVKHGWLDRFCVLIYVFN